MDVVPGFWDAIDLAGKQGEVFVIHEVFTELREGKDEVAEWIRTREAYKHDQRHDVPTTLAFKQVGKEVRDRRPAYKKAAIPQFFNGADPWIVAYCAAHGHIVVTQEIAEPRRLAKVKIPDICAPMGVQCVNTMELLRALKVRLVLR